MPKFFPAGPFLMFLTKCLSKCPNSTKPPLTLKNFWLRTPPKSKIDGLLCIRRSLQVQNFPSEIADIIVQSERPGTSRKYDIYTAKWVQFCNEIKFSPYETTMNEILLFLYGLFQSGV